MFPESETKETIQLTLCCKTDENSGEILVDVSLSLVIGPSTTCTKTCTTLGSKDSPKKPLRK